jgi:hypothetical protein
MQFFKWNPNLPSDLLQLEEKLWRFKVKWAKQLASVGALVRLLLPGATPDSLELPSVGVATFDKLGSTLVNFHPLTLSPSAAFCQPIQ